MRAVRGTFFARRRKSRPGDEAQRALAAAAYELPSPEITRRMAEGLGLATSAVAAATAYAAAEAKAAGLAASGVSTLLMPALTVGVVALTVAGAVVGVGSGISARRHRTPVHASVRVSAPIVAPTPRTVALVRIPPPPPAPAPAPVKDARLQPGLAIVARTPRAAPSPARAKTPVMNGDLRAEIALVDAIRAAILTGDDGGALSLLQNYDARYQTGIFRLETATLRIEVLARLGQLKRARALAEMFLASNPDSVLVGRVERATRLVSQ